MRLLLLSSLVIMCGYVRLASAQGALPREGTCPAEFFSSGKYCVPIKDDAKPAMPRGGQCPSGYYSSGNYCVAMKRDAPVAVPKDGSCPSGYYASGSYCVNQHTPKHVDQKSKR